MMKALAATVCALSIAVGLSGMALAAPLHNGNAKRSVHHRHHHRRHRHHGIPQHNGGDQDNDNNGGPSDGDGNF